MDNVMVSTSSAIMLTLLILITAQAPPPAPQPPSPAELAAITTRGIQLASYDRAAWHATDAIRALHPDGGLVSCYIARSDESGKWTVAFGKRTPGDESFLIAYEAVQTTTRDTFEARALVPPRADTDYLLKASRSLETVRAAFRKESDRPYNMAVLPSPSGEWFVYAHPAPTTPGVWPLGGDTRFTVASDGRSIVTTRPLHKAIIEYAKPKELKTVDGGWHSHVLHCIPEETDILAVLSREPSYPEYVACDPFAYRVDVDGTICFLGLTKEWLADKEKK